MAEKFIRDNDGARERHVQTHFAEDINNPCLYDLVINIDWILPATAARLVQDALQDRVAALTPTGGQRLQDASRS